MPENGPAQSDLPSVLVMAKRGEVGSVRSTPLIETAQQEVAGFASVHAYLSVVPAFSGPCLQKGVGSCQKPQ